MRLKFYERIKITFDVVSSLTAIIVALPIWLIIAVGIKLSSRGPIFFRSTRIGQNLKPFTLYKFRSMHEMTAEARAAKDKKKTAFIVEEDRIFKLGAFLRRSKLDELPQLLNILMGQMSVVGPRPMTEKGAKKYFIGEYECISSVRPGLACLDSLFDYAHGELFIKDEEEYAKRILPARTELAKMYVEKQSIWLDIYCIVRTIRLIIEIGVLKKKKFPYTKYERIAFKRVSKK